MALDPALLARLRKQRATLRGPSRVVKFGQDFDRGKYRLLPLSTQGELWGYEYRVLWCEALSKYVDALHLWLGRCPLFDWLDSIQTTKDPEQVAAIAEIISPQSDFLAPCIDMDDVGSETAPTIKVMRAKHTVFNKILDLIGDQEDPDDVTDAETGRDFRVIKTGKGSGSRYDVRWIDRGPLMGADEAMRAAILGAYETFDIRRHMPLPNKDNYEAVFTLVADGILTPGEVRDQVEDAYAEIEGARAMKGGKAGKGGKARGRGRPPRGAASEETGAEQPEEVPPDQEPEDHLPGDEPATTEEPAAETIEMVGRRVVIDDGANTFEGVIVAPDPADPDCWLVDADGEAEQLAVPTSMLSLVDEGEPEPEPGPEPEPEPAQTPRRVITRAAPAAPKAAPVAAKAAPAAAKAAPVAAKAAPAAPKAAAPKAAAPKAAPVAARAATTADRMRTTLRRNP